MSTESGNEYIAIKESLQQVIDQLYEISIHMSCDSRNRLDVVWADNLERAALEYELVLKEFVECLE